MLQLKGDMIKQTVKTNTRRILLALTGLVLVVSSVAGFTNIDTTLAQSIQDQINSLQSENVKYKNEISRFSASIHLIDSWTSFHQAAERRASKTDI